MNSNPEPEYLEQFIAYWREHSIECIKKNRQYRKKRAETLLKEDWEWSTERKNIILAFKS